MKRLPLGILTLIAALVPAPRAEGLQLDPSFGSGGQATSSVSQSSASALAVQPDGKILAAGIAYQQGVLLVRFMRNGSLDPTFGDGGVAIRFGPPNSLTANAMALQPDGRFLVAGSASAGLSRSFFVARFLTNGDPDPSFGVGGLVLTDFPRGIAVASAIRLQSDGKALVAGGAGTYGPPETSDYAAVRYNADGSLDATFGSGGRVVVDMGGGFPESANALVVEADGRIVLGGETSSPSGGFALVGLLADGAPDPSFGVGGRLFPPVGLVAECKALALQPNGRIIAAGGIQDGMLAIRLSADGSLDPTFGTGGIATIPAHATAVAVEVDSAGRIVLAAAPDFVLARFLPNGEPDRSVGPEGWQSAGFDIGGNFHAHATSLAVQEDGRILLGGDQTYVTLTFLLILRYLGATAAVPTLSTGFAMILVGLLAVCGWVVLSRRA